LSWCTERAIYKDGEYHILYQHVIKPYMVTMFAF
jgi:hypothetical protein